MRPSPASSRRALRIAHWVMLVAFAHQLGACACGCLEHNGWYQTALAIAGEPLPAEPTNSGPSVDHEHCDGASAASCLVAGRVEVAQSLAGGVFLTPWPSPAVVVDDAKSSASSGSRSEGVAVCAPAARTTVWRL